MTPDQVCARIVVDQNGLIVVDKPAGMPTAGDTIDQPGSVQHALMVGLRRRKIWAVHQLDRDTTGLNLFVRRKALVAHWTEALKRGTKTYLAVLVGELRRDLIEVDVPIAWIAAEKRRGPTADGKPARSTFRVLDRSPTATLAAVSIATGRTHQVRVHARHLGHALIGDTRYDGPTDALQRPALHAWRVDAGGLALEAAIPTDLAALLVRAGLSPSITSREPS